MLEVSLQTLQNASVLLQACRSELCGVQDELATAAARLDRSRDSDAPLLAHSLRQSAEALAQDTQCISALARVLADAEHQFSRTEERLCVRAQEYWQPPHSAAAAAQLSDDEVNRLGVHF